MPIIPVRDILYIIPIEDEEPTSSLIHIPESYTEVITHDDGRKVELVKTTRQNVNQGIIKYRGPDTTGDILRGDHVMFSPNDGDELVLEGEGRLVMVREMDIVAIVGDGDNYLLTKHDVKRLITRVSKDVATKEFSDMGKALALEIGKLAVERVDYMLAEEMYF